MSFQEMRLEQLPLKCY